MCGKLMKVLLINPPYENILTSPGLEVVDKEAGFFPPLGLMYVASYAQAVDGCTVELLDCPAQGITQADFSRHLLRINPDVIGIQAMTFTLIDSSILARSIRSILPEAFIVFGGPHPTLYPQETVSITEVDAIIAGEGEYAFQALLSALVSHNKTSDIPGVMTKETMHLPLNWKHIQNLDDLKMPARNLVDTRIYTSPLAVKNPITTMMSSRGCPGRCIFCDRPQMGKHFRKRSARSVVQEMIYCAQTFGIGEIVFYDDTFTIDKKRVLDICDMLIAEGVDLYWDIRARIDSVTPEMIQKLRKAGCHRIHYGVETGSPKIQKRLRKHVDLQKAREVFSFTKKEGIEVLGYFMIGCPDETLEDLEQTFAALQKLPMDYANIGIFTPYPGTEIYREAIASGQYETDYWREFARNPAQDFKPRYWNQYFSNEKLLEYNKKAYGKFYGRPFYLMSRLLKIRSYEELTKKISLGLKLLKSVYID